MLLWLAAPARAESLCPAVEFTGDKVELTEAEKRLVCGDPEREGWKTVPVEQAKYFLRAFLQQRAYLHPSFDASSGVLRVDPGPRTKISGILAEGLPEDVRLSRRRGVVGRWLTPSALDGLQNWIRAELHNRGRGCPAVSSTADADTGLVRVEVDAGPLHVVDRVRDAETGSVDPGVFRRFEAFRYGRPLDLRLLNLSADRVVESDLFLSAYYDLSCSSRSLSISQNVVTGPPRLVTAGVGFDSEDLAKAQVRYRNSRIGWRASRFDAKLTASRRIQAAESQLRWYPRPAARWFVQPRATGRHEDELRYEAAFAEALLEPGVELDDQTLRLSVQAGPGFEYVRTLRGAGPPDQALLALHSKLTLMSHLYEYYVRDPRTGWYATLETASRQQGIQSPFTMHRFTVSAQRLWNVGLYDPPLFVLGWRTTTGTTLVDAAAADPGVISSPLRFFLGGDSDLRGFARKELPVSGEGFLTSVYQGLELRLGGLLPYRLEPLVFVDAAMGGRRSLELEREIYWSPGAGFRWGSPVGAVRLTGAYSLTARRDPTLIEHKAHWQVFFSWGQEF